MEYTLEKKIAGIRIAPDGEGFKAIVDYTITGKGIHNKTELPINAGISVEVDIPIELVNEANEKAEKQLSETYKND